MMTKRKRVVDMRDWYVGRYPFARARDEPRGVIILYGVPLNHPGPLVSNTKHIATSQILNIDYPNRIIETRNTCYRLHGPPMCARHLTFKLPVSIDGLSFPKPYHDAKAYLSSL